MFPDFSYSGAAFEGGYIMPTTILNATFNGVNPATALSGSVPFDNGFMGYYSQYLSGAANDLIANISLTGTNWTVATMRFGAQSNDMQVNITDQNGGAGRSINYLKLGQDSDVNLMTTRIRFIEGGDGDLHDITLGAGSVNSINIGATNNLVTTGDGYVGNIEIWRGSAQININGGAGAVNTASGDDNLVVDGGNLNAASLHGGDDTVIARNGSDISRVIISSGNNDITVQDSSRIRSLDLDNGNNTITLLDTSRISTIEMNRGENTITSANGHIKSIYSFNASNDVTLGDGGASQIAFSSDTQQSHTIVSDGWVGSIQTSDRGSTADDDQTSDVTLNYYAGTVQLGSGNDTVTTGDFFVNYINTSRGDDLVTIGSGGAGLVALGNGDDTVRVRAAGAENNGVSIQGNGGNDTIDFSLITTTRITFTLDSGGAWQATEAGFFQESGSAENLIGTNRGDVLSGDNDANRIEGANGGDQISGAGGADKLFGQRGNDDLQGGNGKDRLLGGAGKDTLSGGAGDDIVVGGGGRDLLIGGRGADVFVFDTSGGRDKVRDFDDGTDMLRIINHAGGFATLDIDNSFGAHLLIGYDGGEILLRGHAGTNLTGADFDFA
jgi:Ca2+-binding RTX toxin-like protein